MKIQLKISSAVCISPQKTFRVNSLDAEAKQGEENKFFLEEPDYRPYINPVAIRRMSRLIKAGIACGMAALDEANLSQPDAIIVGTGRGSLTDTEHFVEDMIRLEEGALNPTYFIQSTYNSVNGWLALLTKTNCYNQTYVHRGHSFENGLTDAAMLAIENHSKQHFLLGAFDELTMRYYRVKDNIDYWRKEICSPHALLTKPQKQGTIAGEGACFFVLSSHENSGLHIESVEIDTEVNADTLEKLCEKILAELDLDWADIQLVLSGENGDARYEHAYHFINKKADQIDIIPFKKYCGEYDTAIAFALYLAHMLSKSDVMILYGQPLKHRFDKGKYLLIVNHYFGQYASVLLLRNRL